MGRKQYVKVPIIKLIKNVIKYEYDWGKKVGLFIDHANIIDPMAGPTALAIDPKVIASPFTEALCSDGTDELISKKLAVKAIEDDIFENEEHIATAAKRGISTHMYALTIGVRTAAREKHTNRSWP